MSFEVGIVARVPAIPPRLCTYGLHVRQGRDQCNECARMHALRKRWALRLEQYWESLAGRRPPMRIRVLPPLVPERLVDEVPYVAKPARVWRGWG